MLVWNLASVLCILSIHLQMLVGLHKRGKQIMSKKLHYMYMNRWFLNVLSHGVMMPTTQTLSLETSHGMYVIQLMYDVCIDLNGG